MRELSSPSYGLHRRVARQVALTACWWGVSLWGQTVIDLKTQSKAVDFTGAAYTRPVKTGVVLPGTCVIGDLFFKTDAAPGSNVYACVSPSTWVPPSGEFNAASALTEFKPVINGSGLVVTCPVCSYRIGQKVFVLAGDKSVSGLTGTGAAATVYVYLDPTGVPKFGFDGIVVTGATLTGLTGQTGITQMPAEAIPVAVCTVASNQFTGCADARTVYNREILSAGTGVLVLENPTTGYTTVAVNPAVVGLLAGPNTWTGVNNHAGAAHTLPVKTGIIANRPATCTVGELYFATDAAEAGKNLHFCTVADTWTVTP